MTGSTTMLPTDCVFAAIDVIATSSAFNNAGARNSSTPLPLLPVADIKLPASSAIEPVLCPDSKPLASATN